MAFQSKTIALSNMPSQELNLSIWLSPLNLTEVTWQDVHLLSAGLAKSDAL